jgi:hypothetical protein
MLELPEQSFTISGTLDVVRLAQYEVRLFLPR